MSIHVITRVWQHSRQGGSALLCLLAIADYANENGLAWPSVATLAAKLRLGERYTQILLRQLVDAGELEVDMQAGRHGCNLYRVLTGVQPASGCSGVQGAKLAGATISG